MTRITDAKLRSIVARCDRIDRDLHALTTGNYRAADTERIKALSMARNTNAATRNIVVEQLKVKDGDGTHD